jgi:glutaredoxin 2
MCKRIVVLAGALVIFGVACKVADQHEVASAASQQSAIDPRMEELKYSQFCTEAAEKFWSRHEWKDQHDLTQITSYTSHYNKNLAKCLVDVHGVLTLNGKVVESDHVYDALEDTVLCGRLLVRKAVPDGEIESVVLIKDGRPVRDKQEAALFVPWFQSLMTE